MIRAKNSNEINMLSGPILPSILRFAIPLTLSQALQLLFNAADMMVLGQFTVDSDNCLAAVGSTTSLINLIISVFVGLAAGANVVIANYLGQKSAKDVSQAVHTSILMAIFGGIFLLLVGVFSARPMLSAMGTPDLVLDKAVAYMQIYFIGIPFQLIYNFGSAVLRSIGDTKRSMYYLLTAGIANVLLNLFFVLVIHLDVVGVAAATAISHAVSAALVIRHLMTLDHDCHLELKKLKIHKNKLKQILRIGLPTGLSSSLFSISNVLIQSSINTMGPAAISGNTIAANIGQFVLCVNGGLNQAAISFTSQNYGARNYKRINDVLKQIILAMCVMSAAVGGLTCLFGHQILGLYTKDPDVISSAMVRMLIMNTTFFIGGISDSIGGALRGMKRTMPPMLVSLIFICFFRVAWLYTVFAWKHTAVALYLSYPISWVLATVVNFAYFMHLRKKMKEGTA